MSGVRSRTGCFTCRIRKKKCDETSPTCSNCASRGIVCYGYGLRPEWMRGMGSWKEVMVSEEAKRIRESAERAHRSRRSNRTDVVKEDGQKLASNASTSQSVFLYAKKTSSANVLESEVNKSIEATQSTRQRMAYASQHYLPGFLDTTSVNDLAFAHSILPYDAPLLMTFLDVIFPLQYGFYGLSGNTDRSWLLHALIKDEPFCQASLGITISFQSGRGGQDGERDLVPHARRLQTGALKGLQQRIDELGSETYFGRDLLRKGMQALAIMTQLVSLEVFSFVAGQWEMHLQAARVIMGMLQKEWAPELFKENGIAAGAMSMGASWNDQYSADECRALEFFITSFVWVDIISRATHGPPTPDPRDFNCLPPLRNGCLKPQWTMGCQNCIMIAIAEITALEVWKTSQLSLGSLSILHLVVQANPIITSLNKAVAALESRDSLHSEELKADSEAVNLVFARAALVYLHTVISGPSPQIPEIEYNVNQCVERIELLPGRLLIRICWPFTVAGCMATPPKHTRFRNIVRNASTAGYPLGTTWKGLRVMEECWRLREAEPGLWCWRSTMKKMNMRILLV